MYLPLHGNHGIDFFGQMNPLYPSLEIQNGLLLQDWHHKQVQH
ncbi:MULTISPECIES: hypothetical protein [Lactobacillus]